MHETLRRRRYWFVIALAVVAIGVDQGSKLWVEATREIGDRTPVLGDLFGIQLIYNPGAAFGLGSGYTWVLTVISAIASVGIAWYAWRIRSWLWAVAAGSLLGGAIANFIDRAFRGEVVDFLAYADWFIGNIADVFVVGGAILAALLAIVGIRMDGTRAPRDEPALETAESPGEPGAASTGAPAAPAAPAAEGRRDA